MSVHADPGLQPERTSLAWTRTLLSLIVVAALMMKALANYGVPITPALLVAGIIIGGVIVDQVRRYRRAVHGLLTNRHSLAAWPVLLLGLGSAVLAGMVFLATLAQ
ncbi:MAG: DUF202 domain-containing protein [Arachnia sp.]